VRHCLGDRNAGFIRQQRAHEKGTPDLSGRRENELQTLGGAEPNQPGRTGPPRNPGLGRLVEGKRQWHYRPDARSRRQGFLGWHERGYLPHFDAPNTTQFVTFLLRDAFPVTRRREWEPFLREPDQSLRRRKIEAWLDRGHGECWLGRPEVATQVEQILRAEDGQRYRLRAWALMPNHVHLVVDVWQTPLSRLLHLWKGRSSREANRILVREGDFWEREYFDTLIQEEAHLRKAVRYTENNPVRAAFVRDPSAWPWSSARWREEYGRLPSERGEAPALGTGDRVGSS
jgi:REP element-mobilizing transposase RayT